MTNRNPVRLSDEAQSQIATAARNGATLGQLASKYGVGRWRICLVLKKQGITSVKELPDRQARMARVAATATAERARAAENTARRLASREAVLASVRAGMGFAAAALLHGVPFGTVQEWCRRARLSSPRRANVKYARISDELRSAAIAELRMGRRVCDVSRSTGVPYPSVAALRRQLLADETIATPAETPTLEFIRWRAA